MRIFFCGVQSGRENNFYLNFLKLLMKKTILVSLLGIFFSTAAFASNHEFKASQGIIENWFAAMKEQNLEKAASYLAPQFVSMHTDGSTRNKAGEVALIKNLNMTAYKLTDFKFSKSGDVIVVTFKDKGIEKIDDKKIGAKAAGRMAVFQKQGDKWLIVAYANLDVIK